MDEASKPRDETESISDPDRDYYYINILAQYSPYELLRVGEEVDIGDRSNPYFRVFETATLLYPVTAQDGSVQPVRGVLLLDLAAEGQIDSPNTVPVAREVVHHFVAYLREVIWEDIRKREFPHRPSRQRCVWLVPNQNGLRFWMQKMGVDERGDDFQVLRVRVQGRFHRANETYIQGDTEPMLETIENARQYWRGVDEETEADEILFEGRMHVEEIMPPSFYA